MSIAQVQDGLPQVMKVIEVARLLRLNSKTVYELVARGEIPGARRVGRTIRFSRDVLLEWMNAQERASRRK